MSRANRKRAEGILWRGQNVPQEWALTRDCEELIQRGRVAAEVDARTNGRCYHPGCDGKIISYPHAVLVGDGGTHDAINRAGVCTVHSDGLRHGNDPRGRGRVALQDWLQHWYAQHHGMTPVEWWVRALRPEGTDTLDTG